MQSRWLIKSVSQLCGINPLLGGRGPGKNFPIVYTSIPVLHLQQLVTVVNTEAAS